MTTLIRKPSYLQIIADNFPNVFVSVVGDPNVYENLVLESGDQIPPKNVLDDLIMSATKDTVWRAIQNERDHRRVGGVKVGQYWFHSDDSSRIQQIGLILMGEQMPPGIMWKTMTGDFVEMTPQLAVQVFSAVGMNDIAIFQIAESHRAAMEQTSAPWEYNFLANWPETFQG